jgi:antitoxin ChpS
MYTTSLRKVGGSVMMAVPPALLDLLELHAGSVVGLDVDGKRLIVQPDRKPRYTLEELLLQCDPHAPDEQDREWLDMKPVGNEL